VYIIENIILYPASDDVTIYVIADAEDMKDRLLLACVPLTSPVYLKAAY
jgi:hypothetical protein